MVGTMTEENTDILVDIPESQLPELADLYKNKAPWASWMVGLVQTGMKLMKTKKYRNYVTFMSPNNCWREDGTIIVTITYCSQDIFVFTLDEECTNLYKGFSETKRVSYDNRRSLFLAVHEKHFPTVRKILDEKKIRRIQVPNYIYTISPDEARNFDTQCSPDIYIEKLKPEDAKQVNEAWPHRFVQSDEYIASYIEINGGYGVFLKSNNKMAGWIVKHAYGHLAMLQVDEEHRRKGYASLVTKVLSKEIAEEGRWPMGTIVVENEKSIKMFERLGFRNVGKCTYVVIE